VVADSTKFYTGGEQRKTLAIEEGECGANSSTPKRLKIKIGEAFNLSMLGLEWRKAVAWIKQGPSTNALLKLLDEGEAKKKLDMCQPDEREGISAISRSGGEGGRDPQRKGTVTQKGQKNLKREFRGGKRT